MVVCFFVPTLGGTSAQRTLTAKTQELVQANGAADASHADNNFPSERDRLRGCHGEGTEATGIHTNLVPYPRTDA